MQDAANGPFYQKFLSFWQGKKFLCVGLDPVVEKLPSVITAKYSSVTEQLFQFNKAIIDATHSYVCAFKPNNAFYEQYGKEGWDALKQTVYYIKTSYQIPVILDAKRGDIGNTNDGYMHAAYDLLGVDAITMQPYLGRESLTPFLERKDKGIIILVKTSNPGAGEFQDLVVDGQPLYQRVAKHIAKEWNSNNNCGIVVGATYPQELREVRQIVGNMPILIPGIGAQGGDIEKTVIAGKDTNNMGMIINSSRSILYASSGEDFAEAAKKEAEKTHLAIANAL